LQDIERLWNELEEHERKKEADIREELTRQEKLVYLVRRFNSDAEDLEAWIELKRQYLSQREKVDSLFKAQFAQKLFEVPFSKQRTGCNFHLQGVSRRVPQ
jgi:hypothetical protein